MFGVSLVKAKRIDARRVEKVDWRDPAMRRKLADAYAQAGGDDEKVARTLGVSVGSARLARKRHLGPGNTRLESSPEDRRREFALTGTFPP